MLGMVVRFTHSLNTKSPIEFKRGGIVMDVRFLHLLKAWLVNVVIELLEKSMLPERFAQTINALVPRELNVIGAKVSNPVILAEGT